jgi:hypothetical protein
MSESKKLGRPSSARSRAAANKERALAFKHWLTLRKMRGELKPVADFEITLARVLSMIRDRMLSLPDHLPDLTETQRQTLRVKIGETLRDCSNA